MDRHVDGARGRSIQWLPIVIKALGVAPLQAPQIQLAAVLSVLKCQRKFRILQPVNDGPAGYVEKRGDFFLGSMHRAECRKLSGIDLCERAAAGMLYFFRFRHD